MNYFAEILIPRQIRGDKSTLTYTLTVEQQTTAKPGQMVEIPLKNNLIRGIIWEIHQNKPNFNTKPISKIIENSLSMTEEQMELAKYISDYYFSPLIKVIKLFLPSSVFSRKRAYQKVETPTKKSTLQEPLTLTDEQHAAFHSIQNSNKSINLLHGITGSGKTEIYRHLAIEQIQQGKQVLILVPEISLTPQTVKYFKKIFGENIAVIHSKLLPSKKLKYLQQIAKGECTITIGSRSAIFAPFPNLGLIVIDEEHENSYKQDQSPRYNTITVAEKIAEIRAQKSVPIKIVLGSATPAIESYYHSQSGKYHLVEMKNRITNSNQAQKLPKIHVIDLKEELKKRNYSIFSDLLQEKITQTLEKKEQVILFLNRRGSASALLCRDCGKTENCRNCHTAQTFHSQISVEGNTMPAARLICHHCGRLDKVPNQCSHCQSHMIKQIGIGTQKVEEEIRKLFPAARVLRADKDTTKKYEDFEHIYDTFRDHQADILIGTQMIGKGLHLPNVTLVGVVLADTTLTIPDFRSAEKTFQLLTQVAGRSGREKPGEVVIQSYMPEHFTIQNTLKNSYSDFYHQEMRHRLEQLFPPFTKLIKLTIEHPDQQKSYYFSHQIARDLKIFWEENFLTHPSQTEVIKEINLFPALIPRFKNKYRWQILLSGQNPQLFLKNFQLKFPLKSDIKIDVDPIHTI